MSWKFWHTTVNFTTILLVLTGFHQKSINNFIHGSRVLTEAIQNEGYGKLTRPQIRSSFAECYCTSSEASRSDRTYVNNEDASLPSKKFKPKLVIFDKYGTLIDFHSTWSPWLRNLTDRYVSERGRPHNFYQRSIYLQYMHLKKKSYRNHFLRSSFVKLMYFMILLVLQTGRRDKSQTETRPFRTIRCLYVYSQDKAWIVSAGHYSSNKIKSNCCNLIYRIGFIGIGIIFTYRR